MVGLFWKETGTGLDHLDWALSLGSLRKLSPFPASDSMGRYTGKNCRSNKERGISTSDLARPLSTQSNTPINNIR